MVGGTSIGTICKELKEITVMMILIEDWKS